MRFTATRRSDAPLTGLATKTSPVAPVESRLSNSHGPTVDTRVTIAHTFGAMAQTVVVTGSTRGLGFGLASAFLQLHCNVVVHGRSRAREAAAKLGSPERVLAFDGDVTQPGDVRALWDAAVQRFGRVDLWINNAGLGGAQVAFVDTPAETCAAVVATNLAGCVLGTRVALEGMKKQGAGQIFNMEGFGSNPRIKRLGMSVYGATKCAVRYFTHSVSKEAKGSGVLVGTLSPGVVVTEMLVSQFDGAPTAAWEKSRRIYNKLAEPVEVVAPYLAVRALENRVNGAAIAWINPLQMLWRIVSPFRGGKDLFGGLPPPKTS